MSDLPVVIIPDPELVLADDVLPPHECVVAHSHAFGGRYRTLADMIERRSIVEAGLNRRLEDWQRSVTAPAFVVVMHPGDLKIYGALITNEEFARQSPDHDLGRRRIEDANLRGWVFGQWFSVLEPLGEYGAHHRVSLWRLLTEAEFHEAAEAGWA